MSGKRADPSFLAMNQSNSRASAYAWTVVGLLWVVAGLVLLAIRPNRATEEG